MNRFTEPEYLIEIHILADRGVGKHTLARNYFNSKFSDTMTTIGVQIELKRIEIKEKKISLHFHFLGSYESFKSFYPTYLIDSDGCIIMYDLTNPSSLDKIPEWVQMIRERVGDIPIILVGNKLDLENREVSEEKAMELKEEFNLTGYFEISARTGENIEETFRQMTRMILHNLNIID